MALDLHTHTRFSDGTTTPSQNAVLAKAAGLGGLALTDHDTLDGWAEQEATCRLQGLAFVPGIELSAEDGATSVHVLGYWVDPDDAALLAECGRLRDERSQRAQRILELLAGMGLEVAEQAVRDRAGPAPIGRPHIAQAMVDAGLVPDLPTAFDRYLADGGPAWVPKHALAPEDAVGLIRRAGGVAVLAHPGTVPERVGWTTLLVDRLVAAGMAGIEAEHAGHGPATMAYWRRVARERDLVVTGSSDFHGGRKDVALGASTTPASAVEALSDRRRPAALVAGDR